MEQKQKYKAKSSFKIQMKVDNESTWWFVSQKDDKITLENMYHDEITISRKDFIRLFKIED